LRLLRLSQQLWYEDAVYSTKLYVAERHLGKLCSHHESQKGRPIRCSRGHLRLVLDRSLGRCRQCWSSAVREQHGSASVGSLLLGRRMRCKRALLFSPNLGLISTQNNGGVYICNDQDSDITVSTMEAYNVVNSIMGVRPHCPEAKSPCLASS